MIKKWEYIFPLPGNAFPRKGTGVKTDFFLHEKVSLSAVVGKKDGCLTEPGTHWEKSSLFWPNLCFLQHLTFKKPIKLKVRNEKLSFFDSKTNKGDYKIYFQCNKKFFRWCYHPNTPKLKAKHVRSPLGVSPLGSVRYELKGKIRPLVNCEMVS